MRKKPQFVTVRRYNSRIANYLYSSLSSVVASMNNEPIFDLLERAIAARESLFDPQHQTAFRLFNGFYEGFPSLVVDLFARTVVMQNYADPPAEGDAAVASAQRFLEARFSWIQAILLKTRHGLTQDAKQGKLIYGERAARRVQEHGVWYAIDLLMNQDASLYLDTRNLRKWALENLKGKTVLNTFAYTGSLGVAARAGGTARVLHLDRNRTFLNVAKASYSLNGFPILRADFQAGDFWQQASRLKRSGERFDCVFLDPPFFSSTSKGIVDLAKDSARLVNKLRPLINDGGYLAAVNNALFLSGQAYLETLESLCADGYLQIETLIPVPEDFTGYPDTRLSSPPVDPAPFNHATKIALLKVRRNASLVI
jgi:23S rRNA (cytosine1962-C5)-methyltransferase